MIRLDVGGATSIKLETGRDPTIRVDAGGVGGGDAPSYPGPYTATPANRAQTFATVGQVMSQNFTVNPIPSNYGLITWNGSTLMVS